MALAWWSVIRKEFQITNNRYCKVYQAVDCLYTSKRMQADQDLLPKKAYVQASVSSLSSTVWRLGFDPGPLQRMFPLYCQYCPIIKGLKMPKNIFKKNLFSMTNNWNLWHDKAQQHLFQRGLFSILLMFWLSCTFRNLIVSVIIRFNYSNCTAFYFLLSCPQEVSVMDRNENWDHVVLTRKDVLKAAAGNLSTRRSSGST